jgi:hypothetical protein
LGIQDRRDPVMKQEGKARGDWNSAPASKRKGGAPQVTREQLAQAIQRFEQKGGLIRTLPPQNAGRRCTVGGHLESGFENVIDS